MVNINDIRKSKPRSDAKLLNLPEENIEKLRDALLGGMKYADACVFVTKEFNISVGHSTVSEFWKLKCIPFLEERRAELAERALKKMEEPESKLSYEEQSAKLREMFGMACENTGRPPKKHSRSTAETMKAGVPDPAAPTSDTLSNQTEEPTEP